MIFKVFLFYYYKKVLFLLINSINLFLKGFKCNLLLNYYLIFYKFLIIELRLSYGVYKNR